MKTKQKYLLPLIIATVGIAAILYFNYDKIKEKVTQPQVTTDWEIAAGDAIKTNDFKQCDKIKDNKYKTVCINNIALNLANETNDPSYCKKLDDKLVSISRCEEDIARRSSLQKEDSSSCDKIQDKQRKAGCKELFFISLAMKKDDINVCNQAADQQAKDNCKDMFTIQKESKQDFKNFDCNKLSTQQTKSECEKLKTLLSQKDKTLEACKEFKSSVMMDLCLTNISMPRQNMPTQDIPNLLNQPKQ